MPRSEHKRQKQQAKKNKRAQQVRKELQRSRSVSTIDMILDTLKSPFHTVCVSGNESLKTITVLRSRSNGDVIMVGFLVDMLCLGVKDAFVRRDIDLQRFREYSDQQGAKPCTPEYAYKCILGAIEFAKKYGLNPHADAEKALMIFRGVDPSLCTEEFVYGKDGEPLLMPGPSDDFARIRFVANRIQEVTGEPARMVVAADQAHDSRFRYLEDDDEDEYEDDEYFEPSEDDVVDGEVTSRDSSS